MTTAQHNETESPEERQAWLKIIAPFGTRIVGLAHSAAQASPKGNSGCWWEDWQDGKEIRLVVTPSATDEHLANLGRYWDRPLDELITFRDAQIGSISVDATRGAA